MEDIEYLEEYEDFILPKTLNYSEEFPVNTIEGDLLNESCNNFDPQIPTDGPECNDNISRCSPLSNPTTKNNFVKIINTEVLRTPAQIHNFNEEPLPPTSITQGTQQLQYKYDRQNASFLDRITQNHCLQRLDKYKSVATVKPTLQRTKTFKLSSISPPFAPTCAKFQTASNLGCSPKVDVNVSNKVTEDDSFLDYAVEKHGVDDFNMEFNLDTAEISDICSDSLNFSDDYNEDIFGLESLLSSEDTAKQKLKRKNVHATVLSADHKKLKYGNDFNPPKQMQKPDKHNASEMLRKTLNQKQQKNPHINAEKKIEKRKINTSGKLVVKKNGKKFLFPDRSKFSLKKMISSSNVEDVTKSTLTTKVADVAPQEINKDNQLKSPIEKQTNIKSPKNTEQEKLKEKDIVIFSSPKNMKRIDSETPIHLQSQTTPNKSTGLSFGHFSLKSIKPPINLKIKEMYPKHSALPHFGNKDTNNLLENKVNTTLIEPEKCVSNLEKNNTVISEENQHLPNQLSECNKEKETREQKEPVSSPNNNDELLKTLENVLDSSDSKSETSLEKVTTQKTCNDKTENTSFENLSQPNLREKSFENVCIKTSITNKIVDETVQSVDSSLKDASNENDPDLKKNPTTDKDLETQSNDFESTNEQNSVDKNVQIRPENVKEILNSNKATEKYCSTENNFDKSCKEQNYLKVIVHKKSELLQDPKNVLDYNISTSVNSMSEEKAERKSPNKKFESKNVKQTKSVDSITEKCLENIDKFLLKTNEPKTLQNEETAKSNKPPLKSLFEPRGFDILLSKNIVAKLLRSAKTCLNSEPLKLLDESKYFTKSDVLIPESNVHVSTQKNSQRLSSGSADKTGTKSKRGRKKKNIQLNSLVQSSVKSTPLLIDSTQNINSSLPCLSNEINVEKEKQNVQNMPSDVDNERIPSLRTKKLTNDDPKRCPSIEITSDGTEVRVQKPPCNLVNQTKVLALATSAESQSTDLENGREESSSSINNTRLLKPTETSQPKPSEISDNVQKNQICLRKELTTLSNPVPLTDNCISFQTPASQKNTNTKGLCDIEIVEPKKESNDETVGLQFKPTNLLSNDSFLNKIKLNGSPETSIQKNMTDLNVCTNSINIFGNEDINPKFTIFELPAYIVMKTKIITRKDLGTNKTVIPPVIKQDTDSENGVTESAVKTERPEFSSICAQINSLLEQNANYLKFASGSERLTRMNDVLGDFSLSVEDANCTLKFLQSYLSSDPRDKAIKTRGQQFIPIYDSQKKIIGYRKRTIHVKPLSSRRSSRRMTRVNAQSAVSVTTVNINQNSQTVENNLEIPPKIEPELDVGESELIVPDTSPANEVYVKNEED